MMTKKEQGKNLKALRLKRGMTQLELWLESEIPIVSISKVETGKEALGPSRAEKLAAALKVKPWELIWEM